MRCPSLLAPCDVRAHSQAPGAILQPITPANSNQRHPAHPEPLIFVLRMKSCSKLAAPHAVAQLVAPLCQIRNRY
eukprot:147902-Pleurochrysis_carterae.AAC.1